MKMYLGVLILGLIVILFWKKEKKKVKELFEKQKIASLSRIDTSKFKDQQVKNVFISSLLLIFWPLTRYSIVYVSLIPFIMAISYFIPIMAIKQAEKKEIKTLKYDFPIWLRQLQILLQNNNVLHALELSEAKAPEIMRGDLHELISFVRVSSTSSEPYYNFMKEYGIYEISRAMKLLYRYQMTGAEESYTQFQKMLEATRKWLRQEREDKRTDKINAMNWIGLVPLLGATALFMGLMVLTFMEFMKGGINI